MATDSWYRNKEWSAGVEAAFEKKLARARDKSQYLRIQACMLARRHPGIALRLLRQYFELGSTFDDAQAYVDEATAYESLGNIEAAIESYARAIAREAEYPKLLTQAYLRLPLLVCEHRLRSRYEQALGILEANTKRPMFPVDRFQWNSARAIILREMGNLPEALRAAQLAVEASAETHSGLRRHPRLGLVDSNDSALVTRMQEILKNNGGA